MWDVKSLTNQPIKQTFPFLFWDHIQEKIYSTGFKCDSLNDI